MQLSRIDLNLFTVFDAIYREVASRRPAGVCTCPNLQSAMRSGGLRELLNDPLFERRDTR